MDWAPDWTARVAWHDQGCELSTVHRRVPPPWPPEFSRARADDLPVPVAASVDAQVARHSEAQRVVAPRAGNVTEIQLPLEHMRAVAHPGLMGGGRPHLGDPLFFDGLVAERGGTLFPSGRTTTSTI